MGVVTDRTILAACTKGSVQNSVCSIHIFEIPIAQLLTILFRRILRNKKRAGKYNISFAIKMLSCVSNGEDPEDASACAEFCTSRNGDCNDVNRCAIADYASQMHPFVVGNCPPQILSNFMAFVCDNGFLSLCCLKITAYTKSGACGIA